MPYPAPVHVWPGTCYLPISAAQAGPGCEHKSFVPAGLTAQTSPNLAIVDFVPS